MLQSLINTYLPTKQPAHLFTADELWTIKMGNTPDKFDKYIFRELKNI